MKPWKQSLENRYCRLLPPAGQPTDPDTYLEAIKMLGCAMVDNSGPVSEDRPEILMDSGYTYFGQFLDHDLTPDTSTLQEAWSKEPEEMENLQTPRLDLKHLYGAGPFDGGSSHLYEDNDVRLKIGQPSARGRSFDIAVECGRPILADRRSMENLVLQQVTAVFARLHNFAVEQLRSTVSDPVELFERARLKTTWQFQWLVRGDYLQNVLDRKVYKMVFVDGKPVVEWDIEAGDSKTSAHRLVFSIPAEFSTAAMRFGHSMVRPNYLFSFEKDVSLEEISTRANRAESLEDEWEIQWGFFFQGAGGVSPTTSRPIDTRIAPPLHHLPSEVIRLFSVPSRGLVGDPPQLAVRTLLRGAGLRLAFGRTVADAFGVARLSDDDLTRDDKGAVTPQGRILLDTELV
ncbi:MAG: peroxidase family protein, partial [Nitrospirota bacterium]